MWVFPHMCENSQTGYFFQACFEDVFDVWYLVCTSEMIDTDIMLYIKFKKTQIQVQIQKVAPPIWKNTHMLGFLQTCVAFSTHLCIWYVFDKSHTCVVFATSWKYKLTVVFPKHVWLYPTTSRTSCWVVNSKHVWFFPNMCDCFSRRDTFKPNNIKLISQWFHDSEMFHKK